MHNTLIQMNQSMWFHLAVLICITLLTRILPRIFCPGARGKDADYHMFAAREIRRNKFRIPKTLSGFILPGKYDYPPLYHYVFSLFPTSFHQVLERLVSAILDACHVTAVYFFTLFCQQHLNLPVSKLTAFCLSLLYIMSPALTSVGTGPRAYQGTPRTLGELLFFIHMTLSVIFIINGNIIFILLAGLAGGLLYYTSKFGVQVSLVFNAVFLVFMQQWTWLLLPLLSFTSALLFSRGHYWEVALGHLAHSQYYRRAISKRFYMVTEKNRWEDLRALAGNLIKNPYQAGKTILMDNTYILLVSKNPQLLMLVFLFGIPGTGDNQLIKLFLIWILAGFVAFLMTSFKPFQFLGEADRYLEYMLFPSFFLMALTDHFQILFYLLLVYEAGLYLAYAVIFVSQYFKGEKSNADFDALVQFIRKNDEVKTILPIYLSDGLHLAYESGKGIAHFPGNFRRRLFPYSKFFEFYAKVYPFPNEDLQMLMEQYQYDVVYFSKTDMSKADQYGLTYEFGTWEKIFSNNTYTVIKPPLGNPGA